MIVAEEAYEWEDESGYEICLGKNRMIVSQKRYHIFHY
jgi:hypothetical protein